MNTSRLCELIATGLNTTASLTDGVDPLEYQSILNCIQRARRDGLIESVQLDPKRASEKGKLIYRLKEREL